MAYTWNDLITISSQGVPRLQSDAAGATWCDVVNSMVWNFADWRISLAELPPFYMIPLVQDYGPPYTLLPPDFMGLRSADLVYNGTEPATRYPPLHILRYLPKTYAQDRPRDLSYESTKRCLRLHPRPPSGIGPMDWQIEVTYKTTPTKVTSATLMQPIPFGDQYFPVFLAGMDYLLKGKRPQDMQTFQDALTGMAGSEAVNLGEQPLSPAEPLVGY